jgi:hypothetical protein
MTFKARATRLVDDRAIMVASMGFYQSGDWFRLCNVCDCLKIKAADARVVMRVMMDDGAVEAHDNNDQWRSTGLNRAFMRKPWVKWHTPDLDQFMRAWK